MATVTFTPLMLRGAGTRGVPLIPKSGGGGDTGLATISNAFSMTFNGVDDFIDLGTDSVLDIFGGDFSVSLWFNHSISSPDRQPLIEIASFTNKMALTLGLSGNTGVGFAVGSGTPVWNYNAGSGFNDGNFHHMVATRTGTTYKIYVDSTELSFSTGAWAVGSDNRIGVGRSTPIYFNGKLDEIALFSTTLDAPTVESIYSASLPLGSGVTADLSKLNTPPVAWYRMGD